MYSEHLRIPGELLTLATETKDPVHPIKDLRQHMARVRPVPAARIAIPATFVHSALENCTHVFLRQDSTHRELEPPYTGPYQVLSWREKTLQLLVHGRHVTVSTDRVKPAYILQESDHRTSSKAQAAATPTVGPPAIQTVSYKDYTARAPHSFPLSPEHMSIYFREGWNDVGTSHIALCFTGLSDNTYF